MYLENLWFSMFRVTVELPGNSSTADIPQIQQFLSYFAMRQISSCEPVVFSNMREYPWHARVGLLTEYKARERPSREQNASEYSGPTLNNSALSERRGGKGARWCHDSHCQTSGTQLSLALTCLRDLMWVCMWMFLCLGMRVRPTEANKVSLCTESGGTLVLFDCSAPTMWPRGPCVWILRWPCVLNGK